MTLLELSVDVTRIAESLEKIVFLLEKLVYPPPAPELKVQQATVDDLYTASPEALQQMQEHVRDFAQLHRVVPGSEAFDRELLEWESQQRSLHGENWKGPDWAEAFIAAAQGGPGRSDRASADTGSTAERSTG